MDFAFLAVAYVLLPRSLFMCAARWSGWTKSGPSLFATWSDSLSELSARTVLPSVS